MKNKNKILDILLSLSLFVVSVYAVYLILSPFYGEIKYFVDKKFYKNNLSSTDSVKKIEESIKIKNK